MFLIVGTFREFWVIRLGVNYGPFTSYHHARTKGESLDSI